MLLLAAQCQQLNEPHLKPLATHQPLLHRCLALQALLDDLVAAAVQRVCATFDPVDLDSLVALHVLNVQTGAEMPELIRDAFLALVSASDQFSSNTHPPCELQTALFREAQKDAQQQQRAQAAPHGHDLSLATLFKTIPALKFRGRAEWLMQTQFEWLQSFHAMQMHVQDELAAVRRMLTALADGAEAVVDWSSGLPRISVSGDDIGVERSQGRGGSSASAAGGGRGSPRAPFPEDHTARAAAEPAAQDSAAHAVHAAAEGDAQDAHSNAADQPAGPGCSLVAFGGAAADGGGQPLRGSAANGRVSGDVGAATHLADAVVSDADVTTRAPSVGVDEPDAIGSIAPQPDHTVRLRIEVRDDVVAEVALVVRPGRPSSAAAASADSAASAAAVRKLVERAIRAAGGGGSGVGPAGIVGGGPQGKSADGRDASPLLATLPEERPLSARDCLPNGTKASGAAHDEAKLPAGAPRDLPAVNGRAAENGAAANGSAAAAPSGAVTEPQAFVGAGAATSGVSSSRAQSDADAPGSAAVSERSGGTLSSGVWAAGTSPSISHGGGGGGGGLGLPGASSSADTLSVAALSAGGRRAGSTQSVRSESHRTTAANGSIGSLVGRPQSVEDFLKQRERILHGVWPSADTRAPLWLLPRLPRLTQPLRELRLASYTESSVPALHACVACALLRPSLPAFVSQVVPPLWFMACATLASASHWPSLAGPRVGVPVTPVQVTPVHVDGSTCD